MLLQLPNVTALSIDCIDALRSQTALRDSAVFVDFGDTVLVTSAAQSQFAVLGTRVVTREQRSRLDYEISALTLALDVTSTSHVLFIEWDARVANPYAWDPAWLQYDYIGAPWVRHYTNGWPMCDKHNNVGNGGFSLRSRRFYELCARAVTELEDTSGMLIHDAWVGRTLRPWLEREGMVFAPPHVAYRFSCENQYYSGQFGWHGKHTACMNGFPL